MFRKFYELFNALNTEALKLSHRDLSLIKDALKELMNAWTDYMMSCELEPSHRELAQYNECLDILLRDYND